MCETCEDYGLVDDPSACGDPDHCSPFMICPDCKGEGKLYD